MLVQFEQGMKTQTIHCKNNSKGGMVSDAFLRKRYGWYNLRNQGMTLIAVTNNVSVTPFTLDVH
jgi:hypothetical protein